MARRYKYELKYKGIHVGYFKKLRDAKERAIDKDWKQDGPYYRSKNYEIVRFKQVVT